MAEADLSRNSATLNSATHSQGMRFRCNLLDEFARLEMEINAKLSALGFKQSPNSCVSQRLDDLDAEARKPASRFKNPARVRELLREARELAKIRNSIVHSVMQIDLDRTEGPSWIFNNISWEAPPFGRLSYSLDTDAFPKLVQAVHKISKHLTDQQLKEPANAAADKTPVPKPKASTPTSPAATSAKSSAH